MSNPSPVEVLRNTAQAAGHYALQRLHCVIGSNAPKATTRHLLLLAWWFPPKITGGVYRPLAFASHAARQGWRVTVVAAPMNEAASSAGQHLADQVPKGVTVIRLPPVRRYVSYKMFPRIDGGFLNAMATFDLVKELMHEAPSVVVPTGPPFHNFAAGWMLSRYFRSPLVLDYRDEWTECPFDFVKTGNVDRAWERRCLKSAAAVMMTTDSFIEHALARFPELDRTRVHKVMNGWEPADMPARTVDAPREISSTIEIAYLGALGDHAPIAGLLSDLATLAQQAPDLAARIRLLFVGDRSEKANQALAQFPHQHMLRLEAQVPKPEAMRKMQSASALLIVNEPTLARYIPGKLFDYVASGTPILVYGTGGEAERIVQQLQAGEVVVPGAVGDLISLLQRLEANRVAVDHGKAEKWLADHTRQRSAQAMLQVLQQVSVKA